jgi:peptide-methionine (S)-S-oxide reductase
MTGRRAGVAALIAAGAVFALALQYAAAPRAITAAAPQSAARADLKVATFAAGCFWCTEADFDGLSGVVATTAGYTGGRKANPSYAQVSSGGTGHVESVQVLYDPKKVSYEQLLDHYWANVDPFVLNQQFCDAGEQYSPEIFVATPEERAAAEASLARLQQRASRPIAVQIRDASAFYQAEEDHQDYARKHPIAYNYYRWGCGRDARTADIQRMLTPAHAK